MEFYHQINNSSSSTGVWLNASYRRLWFPPETHSSSIKFIDYSSSINQSIKFMYEFNLRKRMWGWWIWTLIVFFKTWNWYPKRSRKEKNFDYTYIGAKKIHNARNLILILGWGQFTVKSRSVIDISLLILILETRKYSSSYMMDYYYYSVYICIDFSGII